ncbi:MAG: MiaB/RimO family radical SAM methylthiotransferase [bacterium]|nr:MiaB/RimO family radical SAM methylthiotransferase [bacterium]
MKKTYFIKTFGCQMNTADSERIAGWYESKGWESAKDIREADEVVINTCSVRESAEHRVYGQINNLAKLRAHGSPASRPRLDSVEDRSPRLGRGQAGLKIIVTGCMLRYPLAILTRKMPMVDEFKKITEFGTKAEPVRGSEDHTFISIMEGCNNFCTYCVVPYSRGREKSRLFEEIICEAEELAKRGCKEIALLGQNVNSYGKDFKKSKIKNQKSKTQPKAQSLTEKYKTPFSLLLATLHKIPGIEKISFLTSNPWDFDDDIIKTMRLPKIDRYLHLPVQSGDDEVLLRMNRHYTSGEYLKLIKKIRQAVPEITIGTDIIVGFPGETEEQFKNTVKLCEKVGFLKAYVAMYSPRSGTASYKMADDIPYKEKKRRWKILDDLINKKKNR